MAKDELIKLSEYEFSEYELKLLIDEFSKRFIDPLKEEIGQNMANAMRDKEGEILH